MATEAEYIAAAQPVILGVLGTELAVVKPELVSRLAERYYAGSAGNFDQHIVGQALSELVAAGTVLRKRAVTRGRRHIDTYELADTEGRAVAIERAAARKRLLYGRYLGWAEGTLRYPHGIVGSAGEAAVRSAILEAGTLIPETAGAGEVSRILGVQLPGAADSGGHFLSRDAHGNPDDIVTALVEVKNVRDWIYPRSERVYQVLYKAAIVQRANPDRYIVPILIVRAAAKVTFFLAKMLGFFVIDMRTQYVGRITEPSLIEEVRNELHFLDLRMVEGADRRVLERFRTLPRHVKNYAMVWDSTVENDETVELFEVLRKDEISAADRDRLVNQLRDLTRARLDLGDLGW